MEDTLVDQPAPPVDARIRREARIVGLRQLDVPTLEAVERRRLWLWVVMSIVLVAISLALFATTLWSEGELPGALALSPLGTRIAFIGLIASFCAYAIEKELHLRRLSQLLVDERVLVAALSSRVKELSALLDAGRAMNGVLALDEVLERILDNALELLGAAHGSIMLAEEGDRLRAVCVRGNDAADGAVVDLGTGLAGRVAVTREPLLIQGRIGGAATHRTKPVDSAMSVPLVHRQSLLGVINLNAPGGRSFTEYDLRALSVFAEHAAGAIGNARLYEAAQSSAAALAHQASRDPLTDLFNRAVLLDRLTRTLARRGRRPGDLAVLFCDLDGFKWVNDSHGHAAGDRLLVAVADRLRSQVRASDTVARFGGDEFAVLCEPVESEDHVLGIADRLVRALAAPFDIDGREVRLSVSVGVAVASDEQVTPEALLGHADLAMYRAKERGRNCIEVFDAGLRTRATARLERERELQHAVDAGELRVHYQPIVELAGERVVAVEALVRWQHPQHGLIPPADFIPLAEETGLIVPIGAVVLRQACAQVAEWNRSRPDRAPLQVAVNLSGRQLLAPELTSVVESALDAGGLDPGLLCLEITESTLVDDLGAGRGALCALKDLGLRLAIDDFGTGYASMVYLQRFPVDVLKIDRSFVAGLHHSSEDAAIVSGITHLARSLGLETVAEGVETATAAERLVGFGCRLAQGYHWSRPLPPDELDRWLDDRLAVPAAGVAGTAPSPAATGAGPDRP